MKEWADLKKYVVTKKKGNPENGVKLGTIHQCKLCGTAARNKGHLLDHIERIHFKKVIDNTCTICGKKLNSRTSLGSYKWHKMDPRNLSVRMSKQNKYRVPEFSILLCLQFNARMCHFSEKALQFCFGHLGLSDSLLEMETAESDLLLGCDKVGSFGIKEKYSFGL